MLERLRTYLENRRESSIDKKVYRMLDLIRSSQEAVGIEQKERVRLKAKGLAGNIMRGLSTKEQARRAGFKLQLLKIENPETVDAAIQMFEEVTDETVVEILGSLKDSPFY